MSLRKHIADRSLRRLQSGAPSSVEAAPCSSSEGYIPIALGPPIIRPPPFPAPSPSPSSSPPAPAPAPIPAPVPIPTTVASSSSSSSSSSSTCRYSQTSTAAFQSILLEFETIFVVDDPRLGCEQQYQSAAEAVAQFTSNHFQHHPSGICLYFLCSQSKAPSTSVQFGGGYYSLRDPITVLNIFNQREPNLAETPPSYNHTVLNIISYHLEAQRRASQHGRQIKPIHLIIISSAVPWADTDLIVQYARILDEMHAPLAQVFVHSIQVRTPYRPQLRIGVGPPKQERRARERWEEKRRYTRREWHVLRRTLRHAGARSIVNVIGHDYELVPGTVTLSADGIRFMILDVVSSLLKHYPAVQDVQHLFRACK
ncbi:hypothetical protein E4U57_004568 [Claviceps arundinis]|uniref:VWFA domain-containing protein n=1 Tax=Claviceps arundinis TaxID=1623583 RepID=A0ABQ7P4V2_9HYPO|nr:hypothetical protein E4U57_004568 [Claviceps arundinis]